MNARYSRWLLRLVVVLIVGLVGVFWAVTQRTHSLKIENRSEQPIAEVNVSIGGQTQTFHNVKVGEQLTAEGPARGDELFTIDGQLADTTRIHASGRITEDLDFVLLPDRQLQQRPKKSR
jgi:hypothetical protein